jgi:predicted enzyme related to lactoylglutathione lyase
MAKAVKFYKEQLGAKPSFESPDWTEFPFGGTSLCLHPTKDKTKPFANGSMILHVDGIRQLVADLKAAGVKVSDVHEVHPGAYSAEFQDPEGSVVGLYEGPKSC